MEECSRGTSVLQSHNIIRVHRDRSIIQEQLLQRKICNDSIWTNSTGNVNDTKRVNSHLLCLVQSWGLFWEACLQPRGRRVVLKGIWEVKYRRLLLHHRDCRHWWCTNRSQLGGTNTGPHCSPLWCYITAEQSSNWTDSEESCNLDNKEEIIPYRSEHKGSSKTIHRKYCTLPGGTRCWLGWQ